MKNSILLFLFISSTLVFGQSYSGPESVEWDSANNRWLISNTSSHAILARSQSGTLTTLVPTTTSGPHGLEILGNTVYACCGTSIKGYDLTTGANVFTLNLGAAFLNGLTTDGDSVLYATDFTNKDIFRINPTTNKFYVLSSNTTSTPNGIFYDAPNSRCIFVAWGASAPIKAISTAPPYTITTLTATTLSNCDGITQDHLGYYYVTAWGNNRMNRFASDFTGGFTVMNNWTLSSPADIDCKFGSIDTVGVPNSGNNTCTFIPLAPPTPSFSANDSTICEGGQITYTNSSTGEDSFLWSFPGGSPGSGSTSPINITYATAGTYTTTLSTTNIYGTTSTTHTVVVTALPSPTITAVGNDLSTTTSYTSYQWYQNGLLIPGAISQNYTATSGGEFYCEVTDNGCTGSSNVIISTLGIDNNITTNARIFPNPASIHLTVELMLVKPQALHYSITDMQGRIIVSSTEAFELQGVNYLTIDVSSINTGAYILQLNADNVIVNKPFIIKK